MKSSKLYVGNLSYSVTSEQLKELFSQYGSVVEVNVLDGKGFGFIQMENEEAADKAREALNGQDFEGRALKVDEARPPKKRGFGGGGGGGGGRGFGGGGGRGGGYGGGGGGGRGGRGGGFGGNRY